MSSIQKFLQDTIESYELVREFGVHKLGRRTFGQKKMRDDVLSFIPHAAANGYLFGCEQAGRIVAMSIVGPTHKPSGLHSYHDSGPMLFCYYALVHPRWRLMGKGWPCLKQMAQDAVLRFPHCEVVCFYRHDGSEYKERPITAGGVQWASSTRVQSRSVMDATEP